MNLAVAARINASRPVTALGIPPVYTDRDALVTTDCIKPPAI